jgi:UDP-N-acetylglucosamine 2-epimerase (non-hydrolysing)
MSKLKLMTILGTRPEIIRLSACVQAFDRYFDHVLVHTGQNWAKTLSDVFFDDLEIRQPDYHLSCPGETLGDTMGNIISVSYRVLRQEAPDALLVLGDTNSALSVISAKRLKIPIFHMEAGNRCFDLNVPEEINRRIVDHVADINLAYTEHARRYLLAEGLPQEHIFVTGSPMPEVLSRCREKIEASDILARLGLEPGRYLVVSAHREENIDCESAFVALMRAVNAAAQTHRMPVIFSVHPRSRKQIERSGFKFHPLVRCLEPLGFLDYCKLQQNSFCVLSDSGTLSEESAILGFSAVLMRSSTERPEALDKGSIVIAGTHEKEILQAVELSVAMRANGESTAPVPDYQDANVSAKMVRIIQSYTKIVNQNVWRKGTERGADAGL